MKPSLRQCILIPGTKKSKARKLIFSTVDMLDSIIDIRLDQMTPTFKGMFDFNGLSAGGTRKKSSKKKSKSESHGQPSTVHIKSSKKKSKSQTHGQPSTVRIKLEDVSPDSFIDDLVDAYPNLKPDLANTRKRIKTMFEGIATKVEDIPEKIDELIEQLSKKICWRNSK